MFKRRHVLSLIIIIVCIFIISLTCVSAATKNPFVDTKGHWAENFILEMYEKGIIKGTSSTTFSPNKTITRAEFFTLLSKIADYTVDQGTKKDWSIRMNDIKESDWYYNSIISILSKCNPNEIGVFLEPVNSGNTPKFDFYPNEPITREYAAMAIHAVVEEKNIVLILEAIYEADKEYMLDFYDKMLFTDYTFHSTAKRLKVLGIMQGSDGKFNPQGHLTRAEAATVLYQVMKKDL